jgi:hypothetical protein
VGTGLGASAAATTGAGAALGGAAVAGNVLAAGAAGYGIGSLMAGAIDNYGNGGMFGTDQYGHERDAFDVAAEGGMATDRFVDRYLGDTAGDIAGGTVAALGSIALAPAGLANAAYNGISSLF